MDTPATPAGRLAAAFGRVKEMAALNAADVSWHIPAGLGRLPASGLPAVCAFNEMVWTSAYNPKCEVVIHEELGDDRESAVRFTSRAVAVAVATARHDENAYTVFVRSDDDGIHEVHEAMDTVALYEFDVGEAPRSTFAGLVSAQREQ